MLDNSLAGTYIADNHKACFYGEIKKNWYFLVVKSTFSKAVVTYIIYPKYLG